MASDSISRRCTNAQQSNSVLSATVQHCLRLVERRNREPETPLHYRRPTTQRRRSIVAYSATVELVAERVTPRAFEPFGQVIIPQEDGTPFSPTQDAQLSLSRGTPRFYIMRLRKPLGQKNTQISFSEMNYHSQSSQTLGALDKDDWYLAVSEATFGDKLAPSVDAITVFRIPGNTFVNLKEGTWHAGPLFEGNERDFVNLELSNTNLVDKQSHNYLEESGTVFVVQHSASQ